MRSRSLHSPCGPALMMSRARARAARRPRSLWLAHVRGLPARRRPRSLWPAHVRGLPARRRYALLERQAVFAPLRDHELFRDLIENIDLVLEHFGATLRSQPSGESGDAVWSVQTVLTHIRDAGREWRADRMRQMADLKFTYEQARAPSPA